MSANGDAKAFARLYESVYRDMYYTAFYTLKSENDAIEAVTGAARDGFNSASRLRNETQFRVFMMKTLCSRIKTFFREYSDDTLSDNQPEIKKKLFELPETERLPVVLHVVGRFSPEEISSFTGITAGGVKKRIIKAANKLNIEN